MKFNVLKTLLYTALLICSQSFSQYIDNSRPAEDFSQNEATNLESKPDAKYCVYLHAAGYFVYRNDPNHVAQIVRLWRQVSEDFRAFDINVTTSKTAYEEVGQANSLFFSFSIHVGGGGSCPLIHFGKGQTIAGQTCQAGAEFYSVIHEIGHGFGIHHHDYPSENHLGGVNPRYISYHVSEYGPVNSGAYFSHWQKGTVEGGNYTDDIQTIADKTAFRTDDHGDTRGTATPLIINNTLVKPQDNNGVISQDGEIDMFSFSTNGGAVDLKISPLKLYNNLHVQADIVDENGNVVIAGDPYFHYNSFAGWPYVYPEEDPPTPVKQGAHVSGILSGGTYYLKVTNSGFVDENGNGYTSYSSLGYYDIDGFVQSSDLGCNIPGLTDIAQVATGDQGPFSMCSDGSINIETTIQGSGGFTYSLYLDDSFEESNTTGNFNLQTSGSYYVKVEDAADSRCFANSNNVSISILADPETPVITDFVDAVCLGEENISFGTETQDNINFGWTYTGTGATLVQFDEMIMADFSDDATSGYIKVVAFNDCAHIHDSIEVSVQACLDPIASFTANKSDICPGDTVTFTSNTTGVSGGEAYSWNFPGGTPNSITGAGPHQIIYNGSGTFDATLLVTDGSSTDDTTVVNVITVNQTPIVDITGETSVCRNTTETFNIDDASGINSFSWSIAGGATFSSALGLSIVDVDFGTENSNTISLGVISDLGCESEVIDHTVSVVDCIELIASFTTNTSSICAGDTVIFTSNSIGVSSNTVYTWDFGNSTANGIGPHEVIYTGAGSFTASLSITDGSKSHDSVIVDAILVNELPVLAVSDGSLCENGTPLDLTSLVSPIGGSFEGSPSISWDPTTSGTGDFPLTYHYQDLNGCKASAPLQVSVLSIPDLSAVDGAFCILDNAVLLDNASPSGGVYTGTGVNANSFNPNIAGAGTHSISYSYTDPSTTCTEEATFEIVVSSSITPFLALSSIDPVCEEVETEVSVDQQSLTGNLYGTSYNWYTVDNGTNTLVQGPSSDLSQQVAFLQAQGIFVEMIIPNNRCLSSTSAQSTIIFPDITQGIDPVITGSSSILCDESSVITLSASDANGNSGLTWSWLLNGTPTDVGQNISVSQIGTYSLIGSNPLNCPSNTSQFTIDPFEETLDLQVNGSFDSELTIQEGEELHLNALYSGNSNNNFSWTSSNNSLNSNQQEVFVDPTNGTTYFISITSPNGCLLFDSLIVDIDAQLVVSPLLTPNGNGTNDLWDIQGLNGFDSHDVKVLNKWGTQVYQSNDYYANPWDGNNPQTGTPLPQGTYFYIIEVIEDDDPSILSGNLTILK